MSNARTIRREGQHCNGVLEGVSGKGLRTYLICLVVTDGAAVECGCAALDIDSASLRCKKHETVSDPSA